MDLNFNDMEFRIRPKKDDVVNTNWEDIHKLIRHWQSEMEFYNDEVRFLTILFEKYFTAMVERENIEATKAVAASLTELDEMRSTLEERLYSVDKQVGTLAAKGDLTEQETMVARNDYQLLEDDLAAFVQKFRALKSTVFQLTERIAKTERAKHLISE